MRNPRQEAEIRLRMARDELRVIQAREERLEKEKFQLLLRLVVLKDALKVNNEAGNE